MRHFLPLRAIALAPVAAVLLTGCISFGAKPPPTLLTLSTAAAPAVDSVRTGTSATALTVLIPTVPQKLRTARVPVQANATSLAYLKDAQWVEAPARLFQRLLAETVAARGNRLVLDESQYVTGPGEMLSGELLEFGVDAGTNQAVVIFQALRLDRTGANIVQRRFEARESIGELTPANAGVALNRAANRVASDVAGWVES